VAKLEQWDPANALTHLIAAEKIDIEQVESGKIPHSAEEEPPVWRGAMAAAFQSRSLDNYVSRLKELDHKIFLRYHLDDPLLALDDASWYGLPSYASADSSSYAKSILAAGHALEAKDDVRGAFERYLAIARFGQMIRPAGGFLLQREIQEAYTRLRVHAEKQGNKQEGEFYASLADQTNKSEQRELINMRSRSTAGDVSNWNAFLARASGTVLLLSGVLVLACVLGLIVRGQSLRLNLPPISSPTLALGLGAAMASVLSSVILYAAYKPYSDIFQRFIRTGDDSRIPELSEFLASTQIPLGVRSFRNQWDFVFYFWFAVAVLCLLALLFVVWRFQHRSRASATP